MKSFKEIEQKVTKFNVNPRSEMRSKVLDEALEAQRSQKRTSTSDTNIWRILMKSRKTKFAAAAMFVLATYLFLQIPKTIVAPAYALNDTIKAYNSIRTLHVKGFRTVGDQRWDDE